MIDVGLIGFGFAGKTFHAPVISAVEGLRLAAILQRHGSEAEQAYPAARPVRSIDELLAIDSIRLVVIATPNTTHFDLAKQMSAGRSRRCHRQAFRHHLRRSRGTSGTREAKAATAFRVPKPPLGWRFSYCPKSVRRWQAGARRPFRVALRPLSSPTESQRLA